MSARPRRFKSAPLRAWSSCRRSFYTQVGADHQSKRGRLLSALEDAGMEPSVPPGAYYIMANAEPSAGKTAAEKARHLLACDRRGRGRRFGVLPPGPRREPAALLLRQAGRRARRSLRSAAQALRRSGMIFMFALSHPGGVPHSFCARFSFHKGCGRQTAQDSCFVAVRNKNLKTKGLLYGTDSRARFWPPKASATGIGRRAISVHSQFEYAPRGPNYQQTCEGVYFA